MLMGDSCGKSAEDAPEPPVKSERLERKLTVKINSAYKK
jgi:hypothetical protein